MFFMPRRNTCFRFSHCPGVRRSLLLFRFSLWDDVQSQYTFTVWMLHGLSQCSSYKHTQYKANVINSHAPTDSWPHCKVLSPHQEWHFFMKKTTRTEYLEHLWVPESHAVNIIIIIIIFRITRMCGSRLCQSQLQGTSQLPDLTVFFFFFGMKKEVEEIKLIRQIWRCKPVTRSKIESKQWPVTWKHFLSP